MLPTPTATVPDRAAYRAEPVDPETRQRVLDGLLSLADGFGLADRLGPADRLEPGPVMATLAVHLRYRGPLLSASDLAELADRPGGANVREIDQQIRQFLPDRSLPPDFLSGPLRWQLDTFAWSFHLPRDPRLAPSEIPHALADALARDTSRLSPSLTGRKPALANYERFLTRAGL
jgi:hypothetical protein